jgi:hypothetical protein
MFVFDYVYSVKHVTELSRHLAIIYWWHYFQVIFRDKTHNKVGAWGGVVVKALHY